MITNLTAADIFKQACVNIKQRLVQEGIAHKFRGAVHDEVLLSFQDKETAEIAGPIVREEMKKSGDLLTKLTKLDVSIVISKHWLK